MRQDEAFEPSNQNRVTVERQFVMVDTDIGDDIDDALALALVARSPELVLVGVSTVFGPTLQRAQLAAHLLQTFGCEGVPVAAGRGTPLQPRQRPSGAPQAAILNGQRDLPPLSTLSGPELIIQSALAYPGELILICIGPLTNVASALLMEPKLAKLLKGIVMMGGSSGLPLPEWNVRSDGRAARMVLEAGIAITVIGLNVTLSCQLRREDLIAMHASVTPEGQLLSRLMSIWQVKHPSWHPKEPFFHDPVTVVALCRPEFLHIEEMKVRVITSGPAKGIMVARMLGGNKVWAVQRIDREEVRQWIMRRLLTPLG